MSYTCAYLVTFNPLSTMVAQPIIVSHVCLIAGNCLSKLFYQTEYTKVQSKLPVSHYLVITSTQSPIKYIQNSNLMAVAMQSHCYRNKECVPCNLSHVHTYINSI